MNKSHRFPIPDTNYNIGDVIYGRRKSQFRLWSKATALQGPRDTIVKLNKTQASIQQYGYMFTLIYKIHKPK